jgi:hypothetical protein
MSPAKARLCADVLACIKNTDGLTADEVAARLDRDILSIRPRVSELAAQERIIDSKQRRKNRSGKNAIVWVTT